MELDLAVPLIEQGATLGAVSGFRRIAGAADRARTFAALLRQP